MKRLVWIVAFALSGGCGEDPCSELSQVCELCPDDDNGRVARDSCLRTVAAGDELACEDRLEQRTYEAFGCR